MTTWNLNDYPGLVDLNQCISSYGIKDKFTLHWESIQTFHLQILS